MTTKTRARPAPTKRAKKTTAKSAAIAKRAPAQLDVEKARALLDRSRDVGEILEIRDLAKLYAEYERIRGASVGSVNDALELVLRAQRKFGGFLIEAGPKQGRPKKVPEGDQFSLADLGVSKKEAIRCRKLAKAPEDLFEDHIVSVCAKGERLTTSGMIAATSDSKDYDGDEWGTPPEYIALARECLGTIDFDPASNDRAQTVVLAETFLTKKDDGLRQDWPGKVWLNPPYSNPLIEQFTGRLLAQYEEGDTEAALCLVNNATDTAWCQELLARSSAACFVKSRIPFIDAKGNPVRGTRQGQVFFYFGADVDGFETTFADVGAVMATRGGL